MNTEIYCTMTTDFKWGHLPERVLDALYAYGPMTGREVAQMLNLPNDLVNKTLRRMREPSKRQKPLGVRRVHISAWVTDAEGERKYPRPVYTLGHGPNKPQPKGASRNEIVRTYARKKRNMRRMNFVFNLGVK